jgi:hypothetical protein
MTKTFTPFESMGGGGRLVNTPLSMHSEMMAIHSALSASSTLASGAVFSEKPCFKLSGDSKRKSRLRRDAIKSYVQSVCEAALAAQSTAVKCRGQSGVQEWRFEGSASRSFIESRVSGRTGGRVRGFAHGEQEDEYEASPTENSTEKHRMKNEKKKNHHNFGNNNNGQHKYNGRQHTHRLSAKYTIVAPCHTALECPDVDDRSTSSSAHNSANKALASKDTFKAAKVSLKFHSLTHADSHRPSRRPLLLPQVSQC